MRAFLYKILGWHCLAPRHIPNSGHSATHSDDGFPFPEEEFGEESIARQMLQIRKDYEAYFINTSPCRSRNERDSHENRR